MCQKRKRKSRDAELTDVVTALVSEGLPSNTTTL